ncbi:MAG: twin transmembrane helix small protein [Acetobacteraceae bacterium]|nr:twin transmembrane helix small protein [Acetobacteraceae bacterium]
MKTFLFILTGIAMLGVLGVLFAGLIGFVSGRADGARSNQLMQYRVLLQGVAILLFALLLMLARS